MISCVLVVHMKPYVVEAVASVLAQTRGDFDLVVMDSGAWIGGEDERSREMARIYETHRLIDPRVGWHFTGEPADLRAHKCPISWTTNEAIRRGLVTGEYVCTFYDEDLYYPTFFERMAGFLDEHPDEMAVWCSQDRLALTADGTSRHQGAILADGAREPGQIDCRVDGAQVMFRRTALDAMGDPWMDENPSSCYHSDGIFLERLAGIAGHLAPLPEVLLAHRATPLSTYSPS